MSDFKGKVLVVFFFESECPTCKGLVPQWNKIVDQYKDKPIKFLAVGPHNSLDGVKAYVTETHLEMPIFADNLNVMETMYGQVISLNNVRQFRIIGPDGKVIGYDMSPAAIDQALASVSWKYKGQDYDPRLNRIIDLLEWNQYQPAMSQLRPLRKSSAPSVKESAEKLYQAVKSEGVAWKAEADRIAAGDPVKAFDLYSKISVLFAGDDLAAASAEPMKALKATKTVTDELAARAQYSRLFSVVPKAEFAQRDQVALFCRSIATRFPGTPTAEKASALSSAIASAALTGG